MMYSFHFEALSLLLFVLHQAWAELPIYIDLVPGYGNLSDCAEPPLHDIVRNMASGCGDGSHLTSYTCFCTDSYSKFLYDISTAVSSQCTSTNPKAQATSALKVFEEYCANGESYRLNMSGPTYGAVLSSTTITTVTPVMHTPTYTGKDFNDHFNSSSSRLVPGRDAYVLWTAVMATKLLEAIF